MKKNIQTFKIFAVSDKKEIKFLFHGLEKKRKVKFNKWLKAEVKKVRDGRGNKYYNSAFHSFYDYNSALKWLKKSKKIEKRLILPVFIKNWKFKRNSIFSTTILSEYLFIPYNSLLYKELYIF